MKTSLKTSVVAALQIGADPRGTAYTIEKIRSFETQIKTSQCDLLVLPEALLGGYPKGADFATRVGYREQRGRDEYLQYWRQAIDLDGAEVNSLCELAVNCQTWIVIGVIERSEATLYCTALIISAEGELVAKHRKLMPTASERLIWGQGDGSTLPVVNTTVGKIGAVICWENYMPLMRAAMYAKNIEVWCAPTVDDRDIWQMSMRHIAYEGRIFLVSACQYLPVATDTNRKDKNWPKDKPLIRGGSVIVSPMGEILAGPLYDQEGLLYATIELDDLIRARYDFDPTGHYSRPDIFQLALDETPRAQLTITDSKPFTPPKS